MGKKNAVTPRHISQATAHHKNAFPSASHSTNKVHHPAAIPQTSDTTTHKNSYITAYITLRHTVLHSTVFVHTALPAHNTTSSHLNPNSSSLIFSWLNPEAVNFLFPVQKLYTASQRAVIEGYIVTCPTRLLPYTDEYVHIYYCMLSYYSMWLTQP